MILLDTDHISFLQRPQSRECAVLMSRLASSGERHSFVSVISCHEQLKGWLDLIGRYKDFRLQLSYLHRLNEFIRFYSKCNVIEPDDVAVGHFERLRREGVRISSSDLKIASIALSRDALLLTRNTSDFEKVPGLRFADWTV